MAAPKQFRTTIAKLVHGGQGFGVLEDGRKCFVWGALPDEDVTFRSLKNRKDYVEGIAVEIHKASLDRIDPRDDAFMSTSPRQIMVEFLEDAYKLAILTETFERAGVSLPEKVLADQTTSFYQYRNKMEYSFFGDDDGLHLALYNRGTHHKQIVKSSSIEQPEITKAANEVVAQLGDLRVRAADLKTLILRTSQQGKTVAALFVKRKDFPQLTLPKSLDGLTVVYSNPLSPASVRTKDLKIYGDISLSDKVLGKELSYDVHSFFQVNLEVFNRAVEKIKTSLQNYPVVDMYSGVGTIGLALQKPVTLVESDSANIVWARHNLLAQADANLIESSSESALDVIGPQQVLVVDPPRAGLHPKLTQKILEIKPAQLIYLSCNPSTQARDVALMQNCYRLDSLTCYNFFPRTPHIESLAVLVRR